MACSVSMSLLPCLSACSGKISWSALMAYLGSCFSRRLFIYWENKTRDLIKGSTGSDRRYGGVMRRWGRSRRGDKGRRKCWRRLNKCFLWWEHLITFAASCHKTNLFYSEIFWADGLQPIRFLSCLVWFILTSCCWLILFTDWSIAA